MEGGGLMKKITLIFDKGKITSEAEGYRGEECIKDLNQVEEILGIKNISRQKKREGITVVRRRTKQRVG